MKIGIITFHGAINCGSMLQAYALQTVLEKKYGAEVSIIHYTNKGQRQYYALWDTKLRPRIIKANLQALPYWDKIREYQKDFTDFSNQYMNLTKPVLQYKDLEKMNGRFDIVISGGDQIWNVICRDADQAYFLSFVKDAIKVSYSPSLGSVEIGKYVDQAYYQSLLEDYDFLSVREPNGKKWLGDITNREIKIVADPTFLLTKKEWEENLSIQTMEKDFIFYYGFDFQNETNNHILAKVSKKLGLPIYVTDKKSWYLYHLEQYGFVLHEENGPMGFLQLMKNAKIVFARSFHGILFSIIFRKDFWSLHNATYANPLDDRARHILERVHLLDRNIVIDDLLTMDIFEKIDYEKEALEAINQFREESYQYIDSFIAKAGQKNE